ncbi:4-coumarate-CoA ligase 2 [Neofusicoccum parvum]|nr:4-coumarate-CoA ligase 2 [Neofusicoccum parvum]
MPIFKSRQPDIDVPANLTTWDWLFDSPHSPLARFPSAELAGYEDAITGERLDWAQVKRATTYLSTALVRKHGLRAGETVSLFSQNTIWYPIAMHGALRAGAQVSGASPAYSVDEMAYALRTAKARFLLTGPASLDVAVKAAEKAGLAKERVFLLEGEVEGFQTVKGLIEVGRAYGEERQVAAFKIPDGKRNGDVCGFLSFSSGTTGLPKAVMISHQNVIAQCLQIQQITPADHTKVLAVLPSFHITGLVHVLHLPVLINASVIMLPTFTMPSMLEAIQRHQIGELLLVPPILIRLVRDPIVDRYDLSCVRRFSSGAAPLSAEILALLKQKFPGTGFKQGYGMTESCSCITAHPPHLYSFAHAHTVGTVVAGTEVKIVAPDGREAGVGEPGEILARGPQVVMGYLDNAAATAETFGAGGWLRTGDQGAIDRDGVVTILDRIKEMIKVKGIGVAPAELEDLLLGHAAVEDAAVLGVPDDYAGEVPKAYVVLKEGVEPAEAAGRELLAYVRASKVAYKRVREVEFVDEIPKSASGKILRRVLREGKGKGVVVREAVKEKAML